MFHLLKHLTITKLERQLSFERIKTETNNQFIKNFIKKSLILYEINNSVEN